MSKITAGKLFKIFQLHKFFKFFVDLNRKLNVNRKLSVPLGVTLIFSQICLLKRNFPA